MTALDALPFHHDGEPEPTVNVTRPRAPHPKDPANVRRGHNNRSRGNAIEREVAADLGLRRVGQYGGPEDAAGDWMAVQVKSGGSFSERYWSWLQQLPTSAERLRALVVTDAPGPGHRRRRLVVCELDEFREWFGR